MSFYCSTSGAIIDTAKHNIIAARMTSYAYRKSTLLRSVEGELRNAEQENSHPATLDITHEQSTSMAKGQRHHLWTYLFKVCWISVQCV